MKTTRLLSLLLVISAASSIALGQVIPGRYIAVFDADVADPQSEARALASQHGLGLGYVYEHSIKGFAFSGSPQAVLALARTGRIAYIEADQEFHALGQTTPTGIKRAAVDKTGIINGFDDALNVDIAVIDTGLDSDNPDLRIDPNGVRYYTQLFWIRSDSNWEDDNGHGTHVGGTVAAIDNGEGVVGVAPGARLTAVKVLDKNGSGSTTGVVAGVDWVAARADRFEVANMSLGGGYSQTLNEAVRNAVAKGIVFVVAAGNSAADVSTSSPASEPSAITVSALADSDGAPGGLGGATSYGADDTFAAFSNFGAGVDICAPGVDILSTFPGGGFAIGSGTSMAAPHVTGAAALYIAYHGLTKTAAGVETIANALKTAGWHSGAPEYLKGGDTDGIPEPLLNVQPLVGPVDNPPTVSIASPVNGDTVTGTVTIDATATDDDNVTQVEFFVDGVSIGVDSAAADGWTASWDTTKSSEAAHRLTAVATDTKGQISTSAAVSVTVNNLPDPVALHCGDLDALGIKAGTGWQARVTVTIHNQNHEPVSGATVAVTWSGGVTGPRTGTTDGSGMVVFLSNATSKKSTTLSVTGVTYPSLTYDSTANHDADADSNGTSITVKKP